MIQNKDYVPVTDLKAGAFHHEEGTEVQCPSPRLKNSGDLMSLFSNANTAENIRLCVLCSLENPTWASFKMDIWATPQDPTRRSNESAHKCC